MCSLRSEVLEGTAASPTHYGEAQVEATVSSHLEETRDRLPGWVVPPPLLTCMSRISASLHLSMHTHACWEEAACQSTVPDRQGCWSPVSLTHTDAIFPHFCVSQGSMLWFRRKAQREHMHFGS